MPFFRFADGAAMFGATPIENMFLMDYLPIAPGEYLKVYLYARMLCLHPELGGDLAGVAKALRMDENSVYNAFTYWEQRGLVRRLTDRPPTYEMLPVRAEGAAAVETMARDFYEYRDFHANLQALFKEELIEHHEYHLANDWLNVLGYDQDAVLRIVSYGIETSRVKNGTPKPPSVFKRMDKLAVAWAERGCRTAADVERAIVEDEGILDTAQAVLKRFGQRRKPTQDELDCVRRWRDEWHYAPEQVLDACQETTKASTPSFAYLDAVLKNRLSGNAALREGLVAALRELDASARPTPDQLARYAALRGLGFEPETIRLAAVQCHRKKKTRFEDLEWMLDKWRELGLFTPQAAETYVRDMREKTARVRALLEKCGLERRPTLDDLALYERWSAQFDGDVIDYAAACARGMGVPTRYMDKLLTDWAAQGVKTVADAQARHEAARREAAHQPGGQAAPANPALNYEQREYSDDDFGDDFFFDAVKAYGNGGKQA